jgi:hypothetical protein
MAYDWIQLFPAHVPPGRFNGMISWDGEHVLMYGGRQNFPASALLSDTWIWDGTDWTQLSPAHDPGVLEYAAIAYDINNDNVVLFGGNHNVPNQAGVSNETWVWDRTDWTQVFPANAPSARWQPRTAYDENNARTVLFSGNDSAGVMIDDTWTWDGTDWTQESPAHSPFDTGNANQSAGMLAWDSTNYLVVHPPTSIAGGFNDTWTWDGTDWTNISSTHHPAGVIHPGLANWRVGGKPIIFGGFDGGLGTVVTGSTYTWDGTDWTPVGSPPHNPGARADAPLAYHENLRQVVLFGGLFPATNNLADTWIYADVGPFTLRLET